LAACALCGATHEPDLLAKAAEVRPQIAALLRQDFPSWQPAAGLCPACALRYVQQLARQRSLTSLHTLAEPNGTFPFYHPAEATALSQPERLPASTTFRGRGVTLAFLDSGYYPHPDLTDLPVWSGSAPAWAKLDESALRACLEPTAMRFINYVDLSDGGEATGLALPSLWDGAGNSWHGQMTTTLAAGNGLLSGGHFRGYADRANLLPIKIGRSNGRIPEADILAGLNWLLRDDNWLRYGVRVLNVAVGGDYIEAWQENPVCLAAVELSRRGVLICAAGGNSGREQLYAPAQTPTVLTVGGFEDQNLRWQVTDPADRERLTLYHHNYGTALDGRAKLRKPEILALGRWLPAPILPPSTIFREAYALGELQRTLAEYDPLMPTADGTGWLSSPLTDVWSAVQKAMNAHKWVHPYYQHVDGTSVAVTQVSAVAAQMFEANPQLTTSAARQLLLTTALPLPDRPAHLTGQGILQPTLAVAAALRTAGGPLVGYPRSGSMIRPGELQKIMEQSRVPEIVRAPCANDDSPIFYIGCYASQAQRIQVTASWNGWQPEQLPLHPATNGWWHTLVALPPGEHLYRFWVHLPDGPQWQPDGENPLRRESGYADDHSVLTSYAYAS